MEWRGMKMTAVLIGAGNVASSLGPALEKCGAVEIKQVYSRNKVNADELSSKLRNAEGLNDLSAIVRDADIYIMSVTDDAIARIVPHLPANDSVWMHTSGGIGMDALSRLSRNVGVLYPLQTFTKGVDIDFSKVPFFIEGSTDEARRVISTLAGSLSPKVVSAGSDQRLKLHSAAVFACNFVNHMWAIADEILREAGTDLSVLKPLIDETVRKLSDMSPRDAQTGPARRGDKDVMERHKAVLDPMRREQYEYLSEMISQYYQNERN